MWYVVGMEIGNLFRFKIGQPYETAAYNISPIVAVKWS